MIDVHDRRPGIRETPGVTVGRTDAPDNEVDLGRMWSGIRRAVPWIVGGALAVGAVTFLYQERRPPVYAATTSLVTVTPPAIGNLRDTLVPPLALPDGTLEDALHSAAVVDLIVRYLSERQELIASERAALIDALQWEVRRQRFKTLTVQSRVDYSGSGVYTVRALGGSSAVAAALADASAAALLDWDRSRIRDAVQRSARSLREQLVEVDRQLARPQLPAVEQQVLLTSRAQLQRSLAQANFQAEGAVGLLNQVAPAIAPLRPDAPLPARDGLLAAVLAALILGGVAAVRAVQDTKVRREEDLRELGVPVLVSLPRLHAPDVARQGIVKAVEGTSYQDGLGFLLVGATDQGSPAGRPQIVVCGVEAGVGTSSVVATLAADAAARGLTVLIVDARPAPGKQAAVWSKVSGAPPVVGHERPSVVAPRVFLSRIGAAHTGMDYRQTEGVLNQGTDARYDLVVVDAPPLSVADALALGRHADQLVLIAAAGTTRTEAVVEALRRAAQAGIVVTGIVLNNAAPRQVRRTGRPVLPAET